MIDLELIQTQAELAETALASGHLPNAIEADRAVLTLTQCRVLPEFDDPCADELRREIEERKHAVLEVCARAGLTLGGHELAAAERAAHALVACNPYRESGHALLMETHAARGDLAEGFASTTDRGGSFETNSVSSRRAGETQ